MSTLAKGSFPPQTRDLRRRLLRVAAREHDAAPAERQAARRLKPCAETTESTPFASWPGRQPVRQETPNNQSTRSGFTYAAAGSRDDGDEAGQVPPVGDLEPGGAPVEALAKVPGSVRLLDGEGQAGVREHRLVGLQVHEEHLPVCVHASLPPERQLCRQHALVSGYLAPRLPSFIGIKIGSLSNERSLHSTSGNSLLFAGSRVRPLRGLRFVAARQKDQNNLVLCLTKLKKEKRQKQNPEPFLSHP